MLKRVAALVTLFVLCVILPGHGQERFSFFQASTPESVERMLKLAALRDDDVVVDLGSGDGLIPLMAAKMNAKLRGRGVDIDAKLVTQSNERAKSEGIGDRVRFEHQNAFDAELGDATVVTMWLFPELMRLLRPVILERARPGTRVLTSTWDLGTWSRTSRASRGAHLSLGRAGQGRRQLGMGAAGRRAALPGIGPFEQRFQKLEGVARAGDRREVLQSTKLRGEDIAFSLTITLESIGQTQHRIHRQGCRQRDQRQRQNDAGQPADDYRSLRARSARIARGTSSRREPARSRRNGSAGRRTVAMRRASSVLAAVASAAVIAAPQAQSSSPAQAAAPVPPPSRRRA